MNRILKILLLTLLLSFGFASIFAQNYSMRLDGVDDQVDIFLERLEEWTVSAWIKKDTCWKENETVIGCGWVTLEKHWVTEPIKLIYGSPTVCSSENLFVNDSLSTGWHHIAVTNGKNGQSIYINGKLVSRQGGKKITVPSFIGSNDGENFFRGKLDEIRIWNTELDEKVIRDWMNRTVLSTHPNYNNLVAYYTFDDQADDATDFKNDHTGNIKPDDGPRYVINDNKMFRHTELRKKHTQPLKIVSDVDKDDAERTFKHMTWNIWHGGKEFGSELGPERIIEVIRKSGADIITMQETYGSGPHISDALGFYYYPIGEEGSNLSIMSRFPIIDTLVSGYHSFYCGGAVIELPWSGRIIVFDIWLSYKSDITLDKFLPGVKPEYFVQSDLESNTKNIKEIFEKDIKKYSLQNGLPVIVGGDFNSCSHFDWTEDHLELGHSNGLAVEHPTSRFMEQQGFSDSYRKVHPAVSAFPGATWSPLYKYNLPVGDRIDFIYYKGENIIPIASEVIDSYPEVGIPFPSDHAAVITTFKFYK